MFLLNHEGYLIGKIILNLNIEDFILTNETTFFCKVKSGEEEMFDLYKVIDGDFDQSKRIDFDLKQLKDRWLENIEIHQKIPFIDEESV
jgi:hypothetical protein